MPNGPATVSRVTGPTILVLPAGEATSTHELFLGLYPQAVVVEPMPGDADLSVRMCAAINSLAPVSPLVIVAAGSSALLLPAVARSQHASHRRVEEYLLLDPELPTVSDAWPDARVTIVCEPTTEASLQARLRGWDVLSPADIGQWQPPT